MLVVFEEFLVQGQAKASRGREARQQEAEFPVQIKAEKCRRPQVKHLENLKELCGQARDTGFLVFKTIFN